MAIKSLTKAVSRVDMYAGSSLPLSISHHRIIHKGLFVIQYVYMLAMLDVTDPWTINQ